jgi:hypothetical protein
LPATSKRGAVPSPWGALAAMVGLGAAGRQGSVWQPQTCVSVRVASKVCAVGDSVVQLGQTVSGTVSLLLSYL